MKKTKRDSRLCPVNNLVTSILIVINSNWKLSQRKAMNEAKILVFRFAKRMFH